jgi:hypothetical protein
MDLTITSLLKQMLEIFSGGLMLAIKGKNKKGKDRPNPNQKLKVILQVNIYSDSI